MRPDLAPLEHVQARWSEVSPDTGLCDLELGRIFCPVGFSLDRARLRPSDALGSLLSMPLFLEKCRPLPLPISLPSTFPLCSYPGSGIVKGMGTAHQSAT